jgi:hypothetical protein
MEKSKMKKFYSFATLIIALVVCIGQLHSQAQARYLKFRVVDALGNADTVMIMEKDGATEEFDPELGEINLYGVEPQSDLDIRIIQRTDSNCYFSFKNEKIPYWLCLKDDDTTEYSQLCNLYFEAYKENVDLKVSYSSTDYFPYECYFAMKVTANYYPISIYLCESTVSYWDDCPVYNYGFWNSNGQFIYLVYIKTGMYSYELHNGQESGIRPIMTFDNADENCILGFVCSPIANIKIPINSKLLYPNPSNNIIILEEITELDEFSIVNSEGKILNNFTITQTPYTLDISTLPSATYYLINNTKSEFYSFIKTGSVK